jgi:glycosyltransferase involved in cell wall biosynthesis
MFKASIIIPTFNRNEIAKQCISSAFDCTDDSIEIIIVDDNKSFDFEIDLAKKSKRVRVVKNPKAGVASARNYGAQMANASILVFVDDDMLINSKAIIRAIDFVSGNNKYTYNANWEYEPHVIDNIKNKAFGRYLIHSGFTSLKGWNNGGIKWDENTFLKSKGITSQFFAIKKTDFNVIGGYNEAFPFAGFEDYDFYIRFMSFGFLNFIDTGVLIYHNESDRVEIKNWLQRKYRGGITRKAALRMNHSELTLEMGFLKKRTFLLVFLLRPAFFAMLYLLSSSSVFDRAYFKIVNILLGAYIYTGYQKG